MDYISVDTVKYSRIFGGSVVVKGDGIKIIVPFDNLGFIEFYETIKAKVSGQDYSHIDRALSIRKKRSV